MKPTAAFAAGLWTGAIVVAAVGFWYWNLAQPSTPATSTPTSSTAQSQRTSAQLLAENERLKQTVADLKADLERAVSQRTARSQSEATRGGIAAPAGVFPQVPNELLPATDDDDWMIQALVNEDVSALPKLGAAAVQGNAAALDAVALMADQDAGKTLTHTWNVANLPPPLRVQATRLLAATLEVNPHAEELVGTLVASPDADKQLASAALEGLANAAFSNAFQQETSVLAPPHFEIDYATRIKLIDAALALTADADWHGRLEQAKARLQQAWTERQAGSF